MQLAIPAAAAATPTDLITVRVAQSITGLSRPAIRDRIRSGCYRAFTAGPGARRILIPLSDLVQPHPACPRNPFGYGYRPVPLD